ncbi:MAG TPA: ABC transporter permease subunit [Ktedonobacteraceae bacterium]|nr:ABC transporter permease subunit [Ktedonobacteraceae bacterium]
MSTTITSAPAENIQLRDARPSFFGLVRGEFFKVIRLRTTWIMLAVVLGVTILPYIILGYAPRRLADITADPLTFFYNVLSTGLSILRVFSGFFVLIVTARMIGLEYQLGTIRVLLARGVGRLQLLFAKLLTVVIIALILLVVGLLLNYLLTLILVEIKTGNLNAFSVLTSQFWSDTRTFVLYLLINTAVSILLATAAAVLGRSVSFGLTAALVFFPIDNILTGIMVLAYRVTGSDFWLNLTAYFLGPNLNQMPAVLTSGRVSSIGAAPIFFTDNGVTHGIVVDGTHTLVVAAVYTVIFAVTAIWLTWKRDIKE